MPKRPLKTLRHLSSKVESRPASLSRASSRPMYTTLRPFTKVLTLASMAHTRLSQPTLITVAHRVNLAQTESSVKKSGCNRYPTNTCTILNTCIHST